MSLSIVIEAAFATRPAAGITLQPLRYVSVFLSVCLPVISGRCGMRLVIMWGGY